MSEWKEERLGPLVKLSQGQVINSKTNYLVVAEGLPLLRITDMLNKTKSVFIDKNRVPKKNIAIPEDIIFTRTGQVGLVFRNQYGVVHNNCFKVLPIDKKLECDYLYWYLRSNAVYNYVNCIASGSAQPDLPHSSFNSITIKLPSNKVQNKIASILSAYDDLIENNIRRIALLEQMAEQIYKEWFVRMRFPGYEKTEFEKGVPKGWKVKSIKDFGKVVTGKTPSTSNSGYFGGKFPFIKTPDMHGNIFVLQTEETLTEDGFNSQKSQALPANSICVSCIGTGGVVSITPSVCMTNQQINSLVLENNSFLEFMFFSLKGLKPMIELFGATGATMTNLSKGKFENLKLIKPTELLIEEFSKKTKPVFLQIRNLMEQQIKLKQTRDLLLPRLISGKLRVKEAEKEMKKTV